MKIENPTPVQKFVMDIANNAQFGRLLNRLQDDGKGNVDISKYVNIETLRNSMYWDLYEYLMKKEWGTTIDDRIKARIAKDEKGKEADAQADYDAMQSQQDADDEDQANANWEAEHSGGM